MEGNGDHTGALGYKGGNDTACVLIRYMQSLGWEHYEVHEPEPHILLFK